MRSQNPYYERMFKKYSKDEKMHQATIQAFSNEELISTARIQRKLQVSYLRARIVLDRLISEGFAEVQDGAKPSRVLIKRI